MTRQGTVAQDARQGHTISSRSVRADGAPEKRAKAIRAGPRQSSGETLSMRRICSVMVTLLLLGLAACSMVHSVGGGEDGIHSAEHTGFVLGPTFHF